MNNKITPNKNTRIQVNNIKYTYTRIQKQLSNIKYTYTRIQEYS